MRYAKALILTALVAASAAVSAGDASACGGCFHETEMTQVVGHRMILSVSKNESTLWDQIKYTGDPQSFAWVLPIKGQVDVGVSADALFQLLEQYTQVTIENPPVFCGNGGSGFGSAGSAGTAGASGSGGGGVTIIDQEVVGPYETVQLSSADPQALTDWLTSHNYNVPADIQPIIDAYVAEKFDFLALKLVPGQNVTSMKPVRVTTPGASPVLPLRMVAAGTGPMTAINLWVMGEGRYEPKNFPSFLIEEKDIIWYWATQSSNYAMLLQQHFDDSDGFAWLMDASLHLSPDDVMFPLQSEALAQYADENGMKAQENLDADLNALYGSLAPADIRLTHMFSELSRPALAKDLQLQASADQSNISTYLIAGQSKGVDPCGDTGGSAGSSGSSAGGSSAGGANAGGANAGGANAGGANAGGTSSGGGGSNGDTAGGGSDCNCSIPGRGSPGDMALLGAGLAAAVAMSRRRRRAG